MWSLNTISIMAKLIPLVLQSVVTVESVMKAHKGKEKQDAAVEALKVGVQATESLTHKDIFNDTEVEAAARAQIDAVVHGLNAVNKK